MSAPSQGPDTSAFTKQFVDEARDRLKSLGVLMLRLEDQPQSSEIIADIFREAHSLKGSSQMLGFVDISQIAHQLEDLFVAARRDARIIDARAFDVVFRTIDVISARVEALALGGAAHVDTALGGDLAALATDTASPAAKPRGRAVVQPPAARAPVATLRVSVEKLESLAHLAPEMVIQRLKASERHAVRRVNRRWAGCAIAFAVAGAADQSRAAWRLCRRLDALNRRVLAVVLVGEDRPACP